MPVAPVIRAFFDRLNAEHGRPAAWVFDFARDDVFLLDPAWEYLGRKEVEPALDTWLSLGMSATIRSPIDVFLNAYPGIHSATVAIASHTDHPAFQGAALDLLFTFSFLLDGDLKMTRIMIRSADEVTRNWQLEVLHRLDMEHGVPEGEYKEVKGRFVEVVQSVAKGVEAVGRFVDDDIEYVDPLGAVIKGKQSFLATMKQWYTHGLTDALEPNEVYTPAPDKARAPIIFIFGKLPVDSGIQPHAPETDLSMTLQNGKVNRLVSVPLDERGRTWTREFAAWLAKDSQTRAA